MKNKKLYEIHEECQQESNEYFYYIAGYTLSGVPFGITWEEARRDGLADETELVNELPF